MVESIKELRTICQSIDLEKGKLPLSVRSARKVSIYFTKLLLYTNITGNQTTLLFILIGIFAGFFFTFGDALLTLVGAILLQLWFIFDHVDGEVARYRKAASITGAYLDFFSHCVVHPYFFVCVTFGIYRIFQDVTVFVFGFLASISILLVDAVDDSMYRAVFMERSRSKNQPVELQTENPEVFNPNQPARFSSSPLYGVARRIYYFVRVPNILYVLLIATVLDLVMSPFTINSVKLNWMYLTLSTCSVMASLSWMGLVTFYIKHRTADEMYSSLFRSH